MIEVSHLTKRFGDLVAVDDISFKVKKGAMFALLGPNGAGKSTTIKMLTTLLRPTSGTLTLNGHNVVTQQTASRKSFGIVKDRIALGITLIVLVIFGVKSFSRIEA